MHRASISGLLLSTCLALMIPILLPLTAVRFLLTEPFLSLEYNRPGFPSDSYGFTTADRLIYAPLAIEYLASGLEADYLADAQFQDGLPLFNDRELRHMIDVQKVVRAVLVLQVVVLFVVGLCLLALGFRMTTRIFLCRGLELGGYLALAIIASLIVLALIRWDFFFEMFHRVFFANGTWRFYYSDTLIRLFPEQLWFDAAIIIGVFTAAGASVSIALAHRLQCHFAEGNRT
jgi:integral membrane protein (TIGR01906 family)